MARVGEVEKIVERPVYIDRIVTRLKLPEWALVAMIAQAVWVALLIFVK